MNITTANIYSFITPVVIFFILIEISVELIARKGRITFQESVANMGTAIANQTVNLLVMFGVYLSYGWLYENYRFFTIEFNWISAIGLLLGIDFIFYWVHRWGHEMNILWAAHSPHHSAEEMNYFVALRASVTQRLISFLFFWPLTLIGFDPVHIYMMVAIHLFIAFLHHTEYIRKLGPIEWIFTTPSHHRVHHGANFKYLDKNFGEFLIIWDKMFGSFAEEKEKVVYGMYNAPKTWNPIFINFHYYFVLLKDAWNAPHFADKFRIWFMPTGWRPKGLPQRVYEEMTLENHVRYSSIMFRGAKPYLISQIIFGLYFAMIIMNINNGWTVTERFLGAISLWHMVFNWAGILESKKWVIPSEIIRILMAAAILLSFTGWYQNIIVVLSISLISILHIFWCMYFFRPGNELKPVVVKV